MSACKEHRNSVGSRYEEKKGAKPKLPEAELVNEIPKKATGRKPIYPWQTWIDRLAEDPEGKLKMTFADEETARRFGCSRSTAHAFGLQLSRRGTSVYISLRKEDRRKRGRIR